MNDTVLIVGGGLTGLGTALHLPAHVPWQLFEKDARPGGHARTECRDGFYFDKTGHWLHLRDPGIKTLVGELFPGDAPGRALLQVDRKARIFSSGVLTRYPFQANLFGLPPSVISECLLGFIEAHSDPHSQEPAQNFADFCDKRFGKGISRHFMLPYNRKLWGVDPAEITAAWCSRFVPIPKLPEVVRGAVGDTPPELGYNAHFLYPREGGIETLVHRIVERLPAERLHRGAPLEQIELATRTAVIGGERFSFRSLVATLPLPELCRRIIDLPAHLDSVGREAALYTGALSQCRDQSAAAIGLSLAVRSRGKVSVLSGRGVLKCGAIDGACGLRFLLCRAVGSGASGCDAAGS
jgi:protoporphyrinogen oxidase